MTDNIQKQPPEVFYKKGVLKFFAKFTRKYLCQSFLFDKVAGLRPATYPVDTRCRFNVYDTSMRHYRRLIDVETTSCVYWV